MTISKALSAGLIDGTGAITPANVTVSTNNLTVGTALSIDANGNIGSGVTLSTWSSGTKGIELPSGSVITSQGQITLAAGAYYNSGWYFSANGYASKYTQSTSTGAHSWSIVASNTVNNSISWNQAMTLDANGSLAMGLSATNARIVLTQPSGDGTVKVSGDGTNYAALGTTGGTYTYVGTPSGSNVAFTIVQNGSAVITANTNKNIGIGLVGPLSKLHVYGNFFVEGSSSRNTNTDPSYAGTWISFDGNENVSVLQALNPTGAGMTFHTKLGAGSATQERMRIDNTGNVGIGTNNPGYKFEIYSGDTSATTYVGRFFSIANNTGTSYTSVRLEKGAGYGGAISGYLTQNVGAGLTLGVIQAGTYSEGMRINTSGNIGIGTDAPSGRLHVTGSAITAQAPTGGWPYYAAESGSHVRSIFIDTAGNGSVGTAGYGATVAVVLGQYYDSRALITPIGSGGNGPSDQGTAYGKDLMIKGGTSDNSTGAKGGRLYLSGGSGFQSTFNQNYGQVIIQPFGGDVTVGTSTKYGTFNVASPFSAFNPVAAGSYPVITASGSYGGGIGCVDGTGTVGIYATESGATMNFFVGASSSTAAVSGRRMKMDATALELTQLQGIRFQATQSPSSEANVLDDYEEGTWTPSWRAATVGNTPTFTYSVQQGTYTKVGNKVTCWYVIQWTNKTGGSSDLIFVNGLPFTISAANSRPGNGLLSYSSGITIPCGHYADGGTNYAVCMKLNASATYLGVADIGGSGHVMGMFTYQV